MMNSNCISRRRLILSMAAASAYPWGLVMGDDGLLAATPSDAEGPFYPVELPDDTDNNLVKVVGRENTAPGTLAYLQGRVMDRAGQRIDGARVEIWQCDHGGVYHHPEDGGEPNLDFQGFGAVSTLVLFQPDVMASIFFAPCDPSPIPVERHTFIFVSSQMVLTP
jgi:protocatechuate 3,4-dioxygenase beta subunit